MALVRRGLWCVYGFFGVSGYVEMSAFEAYESLYASFQDVRPLNLDVDGVL